MAQRTYFSIDDDVLTRFNRNVPPRERSKVIESLMNRHLEQYDDAITLASQNIEADAGYGDVMSESADFTFETLKKLERNDLTQ